jgi:NAD(P) transhydrogenase subunit alpha
VIKIPDGDDIIKGTLLTRGGAVVHPQFLPAQAA